MIDAAEAPTNHGTPNHIAGRVFSRSTTVPRCIGRVAIAEVYRDRRTRAAYTITIMSDAASKPVLSPDDPGGFAHIPALDGIRGLAVAMILGAHLWLTNEHPGSTLVTILTSIRMSLWLGVDLFLALSGFLITGILFDTIASPHFLRNFYARRMLRIFPVYYLAIATLALLALLFHFRIAGFYWPLALFLENTSVGIAHPLPPELDAFAGHLWSIALEEQFYLLWPLCILLVRDRRRLILTAATLSILALALRITLVMHHVSFEYTYKTLPCRMDGLLLGGILALGLRGPQRARLSAIAQAVLFLSLAILLVFCIREHGLNWRTSAFVNTFGYTLAALAATSLIALTLASPVRRVFSLRPLRFLGRYSYGIYVWHILLAGLIIPPTRILVAHLGLGKGPQFLAGAIAGTILSVLIGVLSYHLIEAHFLRLKRLVPYRRDATPPLPPFAATIE